MTGTIQVSWFCRIIAAGILAISALFKFAGFDIAVTMFQHLGVESWGLYLTGGLELFAALALLVPVTAWIGAFMALGIMTGAIATHVYIAAFKPLPPTVDYNWSLFSIAALVFICAGITLFMHRRDLPFGHWADYDSDPTLDPDVQPQEPPGHPSAQRKTLRPASMSWR